MNEIKNREAAWALLTEFTQSESLRKHALVVEACMRACAGKFGDGSPEGAELWAIVGLIHDFDYEQWPSLEDHPYKGNATVQSALAGGGLALGQGFTSTMHRLGLSPAHSK